MMKKILSLLLFTALILSSFLGCASQLPAGSDPTPENPKTTKEEKEKIDGTATEDDIAALLALYEDRVAFHGDMHDHADTGPRSDGHETLATWKTNLAALDMDFQAILDHRQVKHMYLPEWDDSLFIGGTEAATTLKDSKAKKSGVHYNMILPDPSDLVELLQAFPRYNFSGGKDGVAIEDGLFDYPRYTVSELRSIIEMVKEKGGFFAHVHPKQKMESDNPLDYWFADYTGLEVFYIDYSNTDSRENYNLWCDLLAEGKRVWATAGCDRHRVPDAKALTTLYSVDTHDDNLISLLAEGDFTCGFAGIRMAIGETKMGAAADFQDQRLVFSVGDLYSSFLNPKHSYRVDLISDQGLVQSFPMDPEQMNYYAIDADENAAFYRVEVHDATRRASLIAIGQPIWND